MKTTLQSNKALVNTSNLPKVQSNFVNAYNGTLESILAFTDLEKVLNPSFSGHYFYVSGTTMENTVTTKHTDGSHFCVNTEEEISNALRLAEEVRNILLSHKPIKLITAFGGDVEKLRQFGKISRVRNRACFIINGEIIQVKGLKI